MKLDFRKPILFFRNLEQQWFVGLGPFKKLQWSQGVGQVFFLPEFFQVDFQEVWLPEHFYKFSNEEMLSLIQGFEQSIFDTEFQRVGCSGPLTQSLWTMPKKSDYEHHFSRLQSLMTGNGVLKKAVPMVAARRDQLPLPSEKLEWLKRAVSFPGQVYVYGGWWEQEGLIGLSPERLFLQKKNLIQTMALAGTAPLSGVDLLQSSKDLKEHQFVVDDISQQLKTWGDVNRSQTYEWTVGILKHLRTDLSMTKKAPSQTTLDIKVDSKELVPLFWDLVRSLHPTPALGVYPRSVGLDILKNHPDAVHRRRFGAPFGVIQSDEEGECCVAIRGLQWHNHATWIMTGGGVVQESDLEKEWDELRLKRRAIARLFDLQGDF